MKKKIKKKDRKVFCSMEHCEKHSVIDDGGNFVTADHLREIYSPTGDHLPWGSFKVT